MKKSINPKTNQPYKLLWFGDLVTPSGFGRIGNEVTRRLHTRGWNIVGASISYTGWRHDFPFWIYPLGGQDIWNGLVTIVNTEQPDVIVSCQDFPYHQMIWGACRIDFSKIKWAWITPIDGTPIDPEWVKLAEFADGKMVISRFGVEAMRQEGWRVELCHPGVDTTEFYPPEEKEKLELKAKAGYNPDDFVVGVVCMNQGRKAIPAMVEAFFEFAKDKPNARLYLDMDKTSPAGWDIPKMLQQMRLSDSDKARVKYKEDLFKPELFSTFAPLRNRYALMDAHMVISHREGFGLPLLESQAVRVPTLALNWCSGTEITGGGKGMLVNRIEYMERGTWGGARDAFPDMTDLTAKLNQLYTDPALAAHVAEMGYRWAAQQTWDVTTDQVENVLHTAMKRERTIPPDGREFNAAAPGFSDVYGPAHEQPPSTSGQHPNGQRHRSELQESPGPAEMHGQPVPDGAGVRESEPPTIDRSG